jgi:hypothetical protein
MNKQLKLSEQALKYAEYVEWLDRCPFSADQEYYELAHPTLEELGENMLQEAARLRDLSASDRPGPGAILEAIEQALTESDWFGFDDEAVFWRYISVWAERLEK